jgi:cyclopropane fatty-acyl-phospholipid synthase-like methyltransferase
MSSNLSPNLGPTQAKYQDPNPIARFALGRFFRAIQALLDEAPHQTILDAGSGEGELLHRLARWSDARMVGLDIDPVRARLALAVGATPDIVIADVQALPFRSGADAGSPGACRTA